MVVAQGKENKFYICTSLKNNKEPLHQSTRFSSLPPGQTIVGVSCVCDWALAG